MDYYYSKNNSNLNKNRSHYQNQRTPLNSDYIKDLRDMNSIQDTLIIDGNTVYEIDEECFEKLVKSNKSKRING